MDQPEIIEIQIQKKKNATRINCILSGQRFEIEEIEMGLGPHKKPIPYVEGLLKQGVECRAMVLKSGKVRIIL